MRDHFVLLVDRLLTESTLEAAIESKKQSQQGMPSAKKEDIIDFSSHRMDENVGSSPSKLVECRICHDEDEDLNMEIPCSCRGSLKYAHHKCIQRWCNEKGDIICEICHQQFKPGYTAPAPLFHYGGVPMNFRENWEISRRDLPAPHFIMMVTTDRDFPESNIDDYSAPTSQSLICCHAIAIIVPLYLFLIMVLIYLSKLLSWSNGYEGGKVAGQWALLSHCYVASPFIFLAPCIFRWSFISSLSAVYGSSGSAPHSSNPNQRSWRIFLTLFTLLMLRTIGILLLIYIMVKAFTAIQHRRHHQDRRFSLAASDSDEESDLPQQQQPQSRLIRIN